MSRPVDWSPLAGSDPIGGDVAAATTEADYYGRMADEISTQVDRLRTMSAQEEMLGQTAEKLREAASDLHDRLAKLHGRFAAVGEALHGWPSHLQQAQDDTLTALRAAQAAAADVAANQPAPGPPPVNPTPDQTHADAQRAARLDTAGADLRRARAAFDAAVSARDHAARQVADHIRGSLHDGLKDGFWDHIGAFIDDHVGLIKAVVEVLSWVATAIAIVAVFCTPFGWVALLAIGLTAAVLAGHVALAASGNGSWTDVAIDAFALVTLGLGNALSAAARTAELATTVTAGVTAGENAARGVEIGRAAEKAALQRATSTLFKRYLTSGGRAAHAALAGFDDTTAALRTESYFAALTRTLGTEGEPTLARSVAMLDREAATGAAKLTALRAEFAGEPAFDGLAALWGSVLAAGTGVRAAGSAVDFTDKALFHSSIPFLSAVKPYSSGYEHFKEVTGERLAALLHLPGVR